MALTVQSKSIGAQNTFSDATWLAPGLATVALSGTWSATVTLQVATDGHEGTQGNPPGTPSTWVDVDTFTSGGVHILEVGSTAHYRFGVKTGDYTSGTVVGVLMQ